MKELNGVMKNIQLIQKKAEKRKKERQIRKEKSKASNKMMKFNLTTLIIMLNVNALIISVKRQRLSI